MIRKPARFLHQAALVVCLLIAAAIPVLAEASDSPEASAGQAGGQAQKDEQAIDQLMERFYKGFAQRDADLLDGLYTDDADWTNAFGHEETGNDAIIAYLRGLFADPAFAAGEIVSKPEITVLQINEDAVMVKTFLEIKGQKTVSGEVLPVRHNYSMKILTRQPDGGWRIKADMYMDARTETTYRQK